MNKIEVVTESDGLSYRETLELDGSGTSESALFVVKRIMTEMSYVAAHKSYDPADHRLYRTRSLMSKLAKMARLLEEIDADVVDGASWSIAWKVESAWREREAKEKAKAKGA
jgi:hypothetical protein